MIRLAVLREATAAPNNLLIHDAPKHLLKDDHDMLLTLEWDVPVKKLLKARGVGLAEPSAMRTTPSRRSTGSDAEKQQSSSASMGRNQAARWSRVLQPPSEPRHYSPE